jgi:hypothetical protein
MSADRPAPQTHSDALAQQEAAARVRVSGWFDALGETPFYPVDSETVCRLLQQQDWRIDHDWLLQAVNERWVPPVPRVNGKLAWDATAIVTLAAAAEIRRRWVPGSPIHFHKLSLAEKLIQFHEQQGGEAFSELAKLDLEGLIGMLHEVAGDRGATCFVAEALRTKLQREELM